MFSIKTGVRRQLAVASTCGLAALTVGCIVGWAAPTLKKLRQSDSPIHLGIYQEGWVVSAMYFGKLLSPFPSGFITQKLGPKRSLLILGGLPIISWILIYFGTSVTMLITARVLGGFWVGAIKTLVPIYTAEISEPHVRGIFGSFLPLSIHLGVDFALIVGPHVSIRAMAIICGVMPALCLILFSFCPESPYFYVKHRDGKSAARSLNWLRGGPSKQTDFELELMQTTVEAEPHDGDRCLEKLLALVTVPANRRALVIVAFLNMIDKLSGANSVLAFSSVVLPTHVGPLTSDDCTVIYGIVNTVSSFLCAGLTHKFGRKPLLLFSSFGIFVSMLWTGIWYFLNFETAVDVSCLKWLPLVGFLVLAFSFSVGLGNIVSIYQGEMFPSNLKEYASALATMINALSGTVVTTLFPVISENIGVYMNFLIFSTAGFSNLLFTHFYVIETEGKSLQTIQVELQGEKSDEFKSVGESEKLLSVR